MTTDPADPGPATHGSDRRRRPEPPAAGTMPDKAPWTRIASIASVSLAATLLPVNGTIATVALPTIVRALGISSGSAVLIVTIYNLVLAMTVLPFAAWGDRIGHDRLFRGGLAVHCLATILCLFAGDLPQLLCLRAIQAASAAATMSTTFALIRTLYSPATLGRGLSLNTLAMAGGNALAPVVGGAILAVASWRVVLVAPLPLALVALLAGTALPRSPRRPHRFDHVGAWLCAATFALVITGTDQLARAGRPTLGLTLLALGAGIATAFVRFERRRPVPVLPVDLLARSDFAFAVSGAYLAIVASLTILLWLPFRLQVVLGLSPAEVGAAIAPYAIASAIAAPLGGLLSDRMSVTWLCLVGLAVAIGGIVALSMLPPRPVFMAIAWRTFLCGAGFSLFFAPNARSVLTAAPEARAAAAGSLLTTTRMFAQACGATFFGGLLGLGYGVGRTPVVVGCILLLAAGLCVMFKRVSRQAS